MSAPHPHHLLIGRPLRYLLTETILGRGACTVGELVQVVETGGFHLRGRPSKVVSDALRWEIAHGRVVRLGRGHYGPGRIPKQTRSWIRCRVRSLTASATCCATCSATVTPRATAMLGPVLPDLPGDLVAAPPAVTTHPGSVRPPGQHQDPQRAPIPGPNPEPGSSSNTGPTSVRGTGSDGSDLKSVPAPTRGAASRLRSRSEPVSGEAPTEVAVLGAGWGDLEDETARLLDEDDIAELLGPPP